ncbi:hypothetical protein P5V15_005045 [Pogonomyrmex californicus]
MKVQPKFGPSHRNRVPGDSGTDENARRGEKQIRHRRNKDEPGNTFLQSLRLPVFLPSVEKFGLNRQDKERADRHGRSDLCE